MPPAVRTPLAVLALVACLCAARPNAPAAADEPAPAPPKPAPANPLSFGVFAVTPDCVVDGDTIRPKGEKSVRILCLDAEETFRNDRDREAAKADFAAYARAKRGDAALPVKYATPAGEAAKAYAKQLLTGVTRVRLDRDVLGAPEVDPYGRRLAHVVLLTPKGEVNFAEAMIRAGHSPYFVKYGGSRRLDAVFRAAERDARNAERGVWANTGPAHYPDYPERLAWWGARRAQIHQWRRKAHLPGHVTLGMPDADKKLAALAGKDAVVFGLFSRALETRDKSRKLIFLAHKRRASFPLVFFDTAVYDALDRTRLESYYITARGKVSLYKGRPQMVVERADQLSTK